MNTDISKYCGAIKKNGERCRQKAIYRNWRCKFHGGLSTGPVTEEGKHQSRINGAKGGRPRKTQVLKAQDNLKVAEMPSPLQIRSRCSIDNDLTRKLGKLMCNMEALRG